MELTNCQQCNNTFNYPINCNIIPSRYGVIIVCYSCKAWNVIKNRELKN